MAAQSKKVVNKKENDSLKPITNPELVFGIVSPIGINIDLVINVLETELASVGYNTKYLKITNILQQEPFKIKVNNNSFFERYNSLIAGANDLCRKFGSADFLAKLAITWIRQERSKLTQSTDEPSLGTAYIIRQFKRSAEVDLMRKAYGKKFIQLSLYVDPVYRKEWLIKKLSEDDKNMQRDTEYEKQAVDLINRDAMEEDQEDHGQEVSEIFYKGDMFVDCSKIKNVESSIKRFIKAFFGHNGISPTKAEYGMYAAAGAALRSIDLSRQVGSAIFSTNGEVITQGCNEVPKAFGGAYWEGENYEPHRDFEEGIDANQQKKSEILRDVLIRLFKEGFINKKYIRTENDTAIAVDRLMGVDILKKSKIMDIIEFGRMVHAEMAAITDAARTGRKLDGSILFCTTFPCHMCAKHIVSSGIRKVVFLEPYPKSYAHKLHSDAITFNPAEANEKVLFEAFIGISPTRYRDIFSKTKRKDNSGNKRDWFEGSPIPRIEDRTATYIETEEGCSIPIGLVKARRQKRR